MSAFPEMNTPLPEIAFGAIDMEATKRYADAALDDNPIHTDPVAACEAGLSAPVLHGMLLMGLFERAIAAWRTDIFIMRLHATFVRPVSVGSKITVSGRVVKIVRNSESADVVLRLFVRDEKGEIACVGEADGRLPPLAS